jgi:hypothetical protein
MYHEVTNNEQKYNLDKEILNIYQKIKINFTWIQAARM